MRRILATTFFLVLGSRAALAFCPVEPLSSPGAEQSLLCGGGDGGPTCPTALPVPATAFDCQCFTAPVNPAVRCSGPLPQDQCNALINTAYNNGLLTSGAVTWLTQNGFCPIVIDAGAGPQIYSFCPVGCFAADTEILSALRGRTTYSRASEITRNDSLWSLSDRANLRAVALTKHDIGRVVHGPEIPELFVFALATGATLRVTQHHPMILDNGMIVEAAQVEDGASFIGVDGRPVAVVSITREPATEDVFNFQTVGDTQLSHVIVADGVLVGDLKLQNDLAAEQASIELRR